MTKYVFKNQQLILQTQAKISISERGFLFGDGIFETCKIYNSKIYDFSSHLKRINFGLKNLKIDADISNLENKALKLIAKNQIKNGILKISISRGIGSVGYLPISNIKPLIIIQTLPQRKLPKNIKIGVSTQNLSSKNLGKTMNGLTYILSKIEAKENGFFDNVILSNLGNIGETSSANIFWIKDNQIFTSPQETQIVLGTKRQKLFEISPFKITEKMANLDELKQADEIFLTNSSFLILPIDEFLQKKLKKDLGIKLLNIFKKDLKNSCKN